MLRVFFVFLLFSETNSLILNTGDKYNITWENNNFNEVSITLESKINNIWKITRENNNLNYLSLIFDGNLNYIWKIPKALRNYDEYNHRLLIKNINNNSIIKEIYFSINQNNKQFGKHADNF